MGIQSTGVILEARLSTAWEEEDGKLFLKIPYQKETPQYTDLKYGDLIPEQPYKTDEEGILQEPKSELEGLPRESIRAWFIGQVTRICPDEGYFEATLKDPEKGVEIKTDFNIEEEYKEQYLGPGAQFIFYIATKHGRGSPTTKYGLEFITPYIWREEDNKRAKEYYVELFPDGPPLPD
jgi:hypothetical protein